MNNSNMPRSENDNNSLKSALSDEEIILRAKRVLMTYLNMTENEAHTFIIKQSMNLRRTKREMAESILITYEN
ncbi:MAG: ANTAR domain-containing protein [Treponema sp.]|nr:ANTAR domain-containing protein [Treponema sp.]